MKVLKLCYRSLLTRFSVGIKLLDGCPVRFQMEECGPLLLKDTDPKWVSHPGVPFIPDAWQKEVLDYIDKYAHTLKISLIKPLLQRCVLLDCGTHFCWKKFYFILRYKPCD